MGFLDEMESLLEASTVAGSTTGTGWALYKGHMPDSSTIADKAVALIQTPGQGRMGRLDIERPRVQVVVRGAPQHTSTSAYVDAQAKMTQARDALHEYTGSANTDGTHYVGIWCENVYFAGLDEGWRPQFAGNFRVMRSV